MRKRTYRRRTPYRPRGKKLNKREVRQVKTIVTRNIEKKYHNVTQAQLGVSTTPYVAQLTSVPQGDTDNDRVGDRLKWEKGYLRLFVLGGDTYNYLRFIIFQWKPNASTVPTAADILLVGAGGAVDYTSQYNHDNRQLFKIMFDQTFKTVGDGSTDTPLQDSSRQHLKRILRIPNKFAQYTAGHTTNGTNQLFMIAISDSSATTHPSIFFTFKIMYRDG